MTKNRFTRAALAAASLATAFAFGTVNTANASLLDPVPGLIDLLTPDVHAVAVVTAPDHVVLEIQANAAAAGLPAWVLVDGMPTVALLLNPGSTLVPTPALPFSEVRVVAPGVDALVVAGWDDPGDE